ncbi:hypothetical protein ACF1AO_37015 [Streptomyces longwoodensis]|uniref:hypothetical protein n=1 Tax=Streptomyces longwoodensis TaxID=68231 RepID=UPI0036F97418
MTVHIEAWRIAVLVIGSVVGYFVFKHTQRATPGQPSGMGDATAAIAAAVGVISALVILFG